MKHGKQIFDYALMGALAIVILYFAIVREQSFIKTLPTLVTLVVQLFLVRASRYAFLLGGANSLLYGLSYFSEGLYFSLVSAVLISAPIQFYSFFVWRKNADRKNPDLRFLGVKRLGIAMGVSLLAWGGCYFGLSGLFATAAYPLIDTYLFVMGITVSVLAARQFVDSQYINIISCLLSVVLWILLTVKNPANFNYIIISAYNLFRVSQAAVNWTKKYRKAKAERVQANRIVEGEVCV